MMVTLMPLTKRNWCWKITALQHLTNNREWILHKQHVIVNFQQKLKINTEGKGMHSFSTDARSLQIGLMK